MIGAALFYRWTSYELHRKLIKNKQKWRGQRLVESPQVSGRGPSLHRHPRAVYLDTQGSNSRSQFLRPPWNPNTDPTMCPSKVQAMAHLRWPFAVIGPMDIKRSCTSSFLETFLASVVLILSSLLGPDMLSSINCRSIKRCFHKEFPRKKCAY